MAPTVTGTTPTNDTTPTWMWTTGGGGSGTYRLRLDNSDLTTGATTTTIANYTPGTAQAEGSHTLYVQERDAAGNWSASGSSYDRRRLTAPDTSINGQPSNPTNQTTASFTFTATETATFECQMDNGAYAACTSPKAYSSLASNQTHTFSVRAIRPCRKHYASPAAYAWMIDTTASGMTLTTTAPNPTKTPPIRRR